jgi:KDO2-lipid IV(A) lauroyltransferase
MRPRQRGWWERIAEAWRSAPNRTVALRYLLEFAAVRLWMLIVGCFPVETNLKSAKLMGSIWWLLMKRHRERAMNNLRPALGRRCNEAQLWKIARRSFEHFAQIYLVEMAMTPRLVNQWSWSRYVRLHELGPALRELLRDRGVIMLTAHFGNYELLGYTIARLGLPLTAVMRPLDNPLLNEFLVSSREAGGVRLLYKRGATESADDIIESGGTLCFIADQDAGRKGMFADFFGRPASWYKSIGLLAMRHRVPLIVGYAARVQRGFHYRVAVERIIQPEEWEQQDDPLGWTTQTFAHALENGIRRWPEQYLWVHRRWKTRPRDERMQAAAPAAWA